MLYGTLTSMKYRVLALASLLATLGSVLTQAQALAAPQKALVGIDISWPQCAKAPSVTPTFVVVGVNNGLANNTNICLTQQLAWAQANATGGTAQPKVQLYVNTANPGGLGTDSWPTNNIDPTLSPVTSKYGPCYGGDTLACAWQYGWNHAQLDVIERFVPAARLANIPANPAEYIWWLDVETESTWKTVATPFDGQSNVAVLEGMTAYFNSIKAPVGLYSTSVQWGQIVGPYVSVGSNLNGLPNWRPGGMSLKTAQQACSATPLTTAGKVVMTQYITRSLDYNYSCI